MCSGPAPAALTAQLLATLLIQYERLQGVRSSGVLIIFWFLCVVCGIIPFRSKILSALTQVRGKEKPARSTLSRGWPQSSRSLLAPRLLLSAPPQLPGPPLLFSPFCVVPYLLPLCREADW